MNTQVNPIARDRNTRGNFRNIPIILVAIVILSLLVLAGVAAKGHNIPSASPSRGIRAETARYTALAEFYARQRPEQAEIARWNGWTETYMVKTRAGLRAEVAEIARLNGLAESYGIKTGAGFRAEVAEITRWNGLMKSYGVETSTGSRTETAEIARWNGLAEEALTLRNAREKADQAYAARLTGLAKSYNAGR